MPTLAPDFLASVVFIPHDQGGRLTQPKQGLYRPDIRYKNESLQKIWMVWPRFLAEDGFELPDGLVVPPACEANFYIVSEEMRRNVHLKRLKIGVHFELVEGPRAVAYCVVRSILSLHANARS